MQSMFNEVRRINIPSGKSRRQVWAALARGRRRKAVSIKVVVSRHVVGLSRARLRQLLRKSRMIADGQLRAARLKSGCYRQLLCAGRLDSRLAGVSARSNSPSSRRCRRCATCVCAFCCLRLQSPSQGAPHAHKHARTTRSRTPAIDWRAARACVPHIDGSSAVALRAPQKSPPITFVRAFKLVCTRHR